jgi:HEPN domain-containing protein
MKRQTESWLTAAEDDLILIGEILQNERLTHMVAFHSQQVIEKCLKAILEEEEAQVPRMHNIITLKGRAGQYVDLVVDQEIFDQINELYIDARYPTDLGFLPEGKPSPELPLHFSE